MSDGNTKPQAAEADATERKTTPSGAALPGGPGHRKNASTHTYADERHQSIDRERVPSAGWRAVYASMGVWPR